MQREEDDIVAMQNRVSELKEALRKEQAANRQFTALLEELEAIQEETESSQPLRIETELQTQRDKLERDNKVLRETLAYFLSEYYPPETMPKSTSSFSLLDLVEKLIVADDYLSVADQGFWAPYVELLLRSGVAEKHPANSALIRLSNLAY